MIEVKNETNQKVHVDNDESDGSNESTLNTASAHLTAKLPTTRRTVDEPPETPATKEKRRASKKTLSITVSEPIVISSPRKSSRKVVGRNGSSRSLKKVGSSLREGKSKRSESPKKKSRDNSEKLPKNTRHGEEKLSKSSKHGVEKLSRSSRHGEEKKSKQDDDSEKLSRSSKHGEENKSNQDEGSEKLSRSSKHGEEKLSKSSKHGEKLSKSSKHGEEKKSRRSSRRSVSPPKRTKHRDSSRKRSGRSQSPSKRSKENAIPRKPMRNRSDASKKSIKKTKDKKETESKEVSERRGRSGRRSEENDAPEGGKTQRRSRGGSRKPMRERLKQRKEAKQQTTEDAIVEKPRMKRSSSSKITNTPVEEMKNELNYFFKKANQAPSIRKMTRRLSTGSHMHLTEEERTVTSASVAPPLSPGSPPARPHRAIMAALSPQSKKPLLVKKKVWFASEETNTYRVNDVMDEEGVKTLWYDVDELQFFKQSCNETVVEITEKASKASEWHQQILDAFNILSSAVSEETMEEAQKATYMLKEVYADSLELVGIEHLFVDDIKYDGNRRRGKFLDFVDKIQDERHILRHGSNGNEESLLNECLQSSRPSRFFFHATAVARLVASDD